MLYQIALQFAAMGENFVHGQIDFCSDVYLIKHSDTSPETASAPDSSNGLELVKEYSFIEDSD